MDNRCSLGESCGEEEISRQLKSWELGDEDILSIFLGTQYDDSKT